ncbi:glycerol dehydrogenase, partial [Limosilactobacillus ingluviei]|uniref:glycerol dehydrogenase n=1 Tax=Limosilactobacillus ingluviei TaxID=148604 RepID=UPI0023F45913
MATTVFASPATYVQGSDVLFQSAPYLHQLGDRLLIMGGQTVFDLLGAQFFTYLKGQGFTLQEVEFQGEASEAEINRITTIGQEFQANVIVGLGGGKTLDSAKAIADNLGCKVAILPTLASTDAPCSRLSVIYHEDGSFANYRFYSHNPDLVLVDTKVIAQAPARYFASGIADALATNVEAQAVHQAAGKTMLDAQQTQVGLAIAERCEATLFAYGEMALSAVANQTSSQAVEKIVEANTLMSGVGFESGGLSAAHAIHNGLSTLTGRIHEMTHGEKVAFGTLTQLMLEGADQTRFEKYLKLMLA